MAGPLWCYQRLAIAVLEKSLVDAWSRNDRLRHDALRFLRPEDKLLRLWCQAAQVSPRIVIERATKPPDVRWARPGSQIAGVLSEDELCAE